MEIFEFEEPKITRKIEFFGPTPNINYKRINTPPIFNLKKAEDDVNETIAAPSSEVFVFCADRSKIQRNNDFKMDTSIYTLKISNLPFSYKNADLSNLLIFEKGFTGVTNCFVILDDEGKSRGYGYIKILGKKNSEKIREAIDGTRIDINVINVTRAD